MCIHNNKNKTKNRIKRKKIIEERKESKVDRQNKCQESKNHSIRSEILIEPEKNTINLCCGKVTR